MANKVCRFEIVAVRLVVIEIVFVFLVAILD
jgi:hypothetical protein